jgi:hypothetical protein
MFIAINGLQKAELTIIRIIPCPVVLCKRNTLGQLTEETLDYQSKYR